MSRPEPLAEQFGDHHAQEFSSYAWCSQLFDLRIDLLRRREDDLEAHRFVDG
jgi:hypothetical protein